MSLVTLPLPRRMMYMVTLSMIIIPNLSRTFLVVGFESYKFRSGYKRCHKEIHVC